MATNSTLSGIIPPLTTPFRSDGAVDLDGLTRNVARYQQARLGGYLVFGSNGEAVHLDRGERRRVLATVRAALGPEPFVLAGVNAQSTKEAADDISRSAEAGANAALVITPYFYKGSMSQPVLEGFYTDLAERSPLPLLVYNIPQNTGVRVAPHTLATLAQHERIIGTKDSAGNLGILAETIRQVPSDFRVFVGSASIVHAALVAGAAGGILAAACVVPEACVALHDAVVAGDHDRAAGLQRRLAPLGNLVTSDLGITGLKAALDAIDLVGGAPRRPLLPAAPEARARIARELEASGLLGHASV